MRSAATILSLSSLLFPTISARYVLADNYDPSSFYQGFDFFNETDPTEGHVEYLSQSGAATAKLAGFIPGQDNAIYLGVDHSSQAPQGRPSLRLTSKKSYNKGLFLADITHMPWGCGVWPAYWLLGQTGTWPQSGEIDIIEGINSQINALYTLHTVAGCSIDPASATTSSPSSNSSPASSNSTTTVANSSFTGNLHTKDCDVNSKTQAHNAGCQIGDPSQYSFGPGFNDVNGGIFATEWTSSGIAIWFFSRHSIPASLNPSSGNPPASPDTSTWGAPVARFAGSGCNFDSHFKDMQIIFDTTFCGQWAGEEWTSDKVCGKKAPTCEQYVTENPLEFQDAFWGIKSVRVYQDV